jgi:cobalamin biosynthesis protein CobT
MTNDFKSRVTKMAECSNRLAEDITRLIQVESVEEWEFNARRGRLHGGSLYKVPTNAVDVFRRVNDRCITQNTALEFLGDASGSMSGDKFEALTASFAMLNEACSRVGATFEFTLFTENGDPTPEFFVVKSWDRSATKEQIIARCEYVNKSYLGNNPDGEALMWAARRLLARPEQNKILVVLSDGQPCTRAVGDAATHLTKTVQALEQVIDVVGIGLMSNDVRRFYRKHHIIDRAEDLPNMFLKLLEEKILGAI